MIRVELIRGEHTSLDEIAKNHLNITKVQKDGKDITRQYNTENVLERLMAVNIS